MRLVIIFNAIFLVLINKIQKSVFRNNFHCNAMRIVESYLVFVIQKKYCTRTLLFKYRKTSEFLSIEDCVNETNDSYGNQSYIEVKIVM